MNRLGKTETGIPDGRRLVSLGRDRRCRHLTYFYSVAVAEGYRLGGQVGILDLQYRRVRVGIEASTLLEVKNLEVYFPIISGLLRRTTGYVRAVDDASFDLRDGETLSLVGESGCGKTTTGRAILRAVEPTVGDIIFRMRDDSRVNTTTVDREVLRLLRQEMQLIFQDPFASLNPRMTVFDVVADPLRVNHMANPHFPRVGFIVTNTSASRE